VWVGNRAPGQRLHELGVPYYGGKTQPDLHKPAGQSIAVSIDSHHKGKNFQHAWHRALVLTLPANSPMWEQLIGREHREGQRADTITVEPICATDRHAKTLTKVLADARADELASGFPQKLTIADWV
jgi:hypothetical protein